MSIEVPKARGGVPRAPHSWMQAGCTVQGSISEASTAHLQGSSLILAFSFSWARRVAPTHCLWKWLGWREPLHLHKMLQHLQGMLLPPPQAAGLEHPPDVSMAATLI